MSTTKERFAQLSQAITNHPDAQEFASPGCCRIWTGLSIQILKQKGFANEIPLEAREVYISSTLSHTFLRVTIDNVNYLLDGTGVLFHPPFLGFEDDAPMHLQNSTSDKMINAQFEIQSTG